MAMSGETGSQASIADESSHTGAKKRRSERDAYMINSDRKMVGIL
jgi:hypothetical protein